VCVQCSLVTVFVSVLCVYVGVCVSYVYVLTFVHISRIRPLHVLSAEQTCLVLKVRGIHRNQLAVQLILYLVIDIVQDVTIYKTPSL
jgi:hypothetical protein